MDKVKAATYARERVKGKSRRESAVIAGMPTTIADATDKEQRYPDLSTALKKELAEARKHAGTTKEDIIDIIMEAINAARLIEDPACMIMGARELSKMLGYNAPEVKKVTHEIDGKTLTALENLSDSELLRMSRGRVIDAEVTRLPESIKPQS